MLDPAEIEADGNMRGTILHLVAVADFPDQRVEVDNWVDLFQRTVLRLEHLIKDGVRDLRDRLVAEVRVDRVSEVMLNVAVQ